MMGGGVQRPPMHRSGGVNAQHSSLVVHLSSTFEHSGVEGLHLPATQKPPQQSSPLVHVVPSDLHGVRVANARMFPDVNSWPGK